jgi:hypothetical protein
MKPHSPRRRLLPLLPAGLALALLASAGAHAACTAANANANLAERTPTADFTLHGDGTATHAKTGLMWKRCPEGASELWNGSTCTSSASTYTWTDALLKAKNANFAGYNDWRLPSIKELQSIAETCGYSPALNTGVFPGSAPWGGSPGFWSATSRNDTPSDAWYVSVDYGYVLNFVKSSPFSVRLVRGGQSFGSFDRRLDYVPDAGSFGSFNGASLSTEYSGSRVLSGLTTPTGIKITNGEYRIDGGSYTTAPGVVSNGQTVQVRHTSSASYATTVTTTLTVGGVDSTLVSITQSAPTAPSAPQNVVGTAGNGQISVAFDTPASNGTVAGGGAATITGYTADCGGLTNNGGSSPLLVTGLTNGTPYACTVTATNSASLTGPAGTAASVTPATVPDAPTGVSASAGNAQATVSFSAPGSNGGAAIDNYRATCGGATATGSASPITVTGLSNGTSVACTVAAHNSVGWSAGSSASGSVTPSAPTAPGAPASVVGTPGNAQISVAFVAPVSPGTLAGGSAATITGYTATCGSQNNTGAASPIVVSSLTNGTGYACTVTATNNVPLTGSAGTAASVTPRTVPDAPTQPAATPRPRAVALGFTDGGTGGASIDQYRAVCTSSDGGATATSYGAAAPFSAGLLTAGKTYTCVVAAHNAAGWGGDSPASASFSVPAAAHAILPDSGQSTCYDGSSMVACTGANTGDSAPYKRQDARYGRDAAAANGELAKTGGGEAGFDYTALDASGAATTATTGATPHPCVRDNLTGLVWEVKTDDGGLHDWDWTYTWYSTDGATNGGNAGATGSATCHASLGTTCNTEAYVAAVNAAGWCGFTDWRVPSARELLSIVHYGRTNPAIDPGYFPNTPAGWPGYVFWSADSFKNDPSGAWVVYVSKGNVDYSNGKSNPFSVRLVRGGQF